MDKDVGILLNNTAEGDMDALGELYNALSVRIFNYARSIVKNKEMAEDITHDVFMRILKQSARFAGMTNPTAYIMTATRNCAYDHLRRGKRAEAPFDGLAEISAASSPCDQLIMDDALSLLPANQRETVYLHYVCGYTQQEVARIMGTPLVTVKWRRKKAISALQAYFNK